VEAVQPSSFFFFCLYKILSLVGCLLRAGRTTSFLFAALPDDGSDATVMIFLLSAGDKRGGRFFTLSL